MKSGVSARLTILAAARSAPRRNAPRRGLTAGDRRPAARLVDLPATLTWR